MPLGKHAAESSPRPKTPDARRRRWLTRGAVGVAGITAAAIFHPSTPHNPPAPVAPPKEIPSTTPTHHTRKPIKDGSYRIDACGNYSDRVLLTFDDWPYDNPKKLKTVVRWAANHDVGLLLFPIGDFSRAYTKKTGEDLPRFAREHGQYVGNHSKDHPVMTDLSTHQIKTEISQGVRSDIFRPPYGEYNDKVKTVAQHMGYRVCTWSEDTGDWTGKSSSEIKDYVLENTHPGSVVLQHMNHNAFNVATLSEEVTGLRHEGLEVCRPWEPNGQVATSPEFLPKKLPC